MLIQSATIIWGVAQMYSQVESTARDLETLTKRVDTETSVILTREQLNDILGSYDERSRNLEYRLDRIETKLDRALP